MKTLPFVGLIFAAIVGAYFLFFRPDDISHATMRGPPGALSGENPAVDAATREKALKVAHEHIRSKYPAWIGGLSRPWSVVVVGSTLEAREELPENMVGGGAVIVLDRATLQVVRAFHFQ
jgi:hypothetical protein